MSQLNDEWLVLNDGERKATHHFETYDIRDASEQPWTDEDTILQCRMMQEAATAVKRIEARQKIIYRLLQRKHDPVATHLRDALLAVIFTYALVHW
jgi:hypothetical protein